MTTRARLGGKQVKVDTASAGITRGALAYQEGFFGVAVTDADSGAEIWLHISGAHTVAVPASTVKGDRLYADLTSESVGLTLKRTSYAAGEYFIGTALEARNAAGKALVLLNQQRSSPYSSAAAESAELNTLAGAIPAAAVTAPTATPLSDPTGAVPMTGAAADSMDTAIDEIGARFTNVELAINTIITRLETAGILTEN